MLRRLPERHKRFVANLLAGEHETTQFDALFEEPHDDIQVGGGVC